MTEQEEGFLSYMFGDLESSNPYMDGESLAAIANWTYGWCSAKLKYPDIPRKGFYDNE